MAAKALRLVLPYLPNLASVGGNARPGHYMQRHRQEKTDRATWWLLIREALGPPPYPHFKRARMTVTVHYSDKRHRDKANIIRALKHLVDAFGPAKGTAPGWGILAGDDVTVLDDSYIIELGSELGPMTIIEIRES